MLDRVIQIIMWAHLGYSVKRSTDIEDPFWVSRDAFRDHDASTTLFSNFVDVRTAFANNYGCILGNDQATHMNHG